jgi:hypothetical protein
MTPEDQPSIKEQPTKLRDDLARTLGLLTLLAFGVALFGLAYSLAKIDSRIDHLEAALVSTSVQTSGAPSAELCNAEVAASEKKFYTRLGYGVPDEIWECRHSETIPPGFTWEPATMGEWRDRDAVAGEIVKSAVELPSKSNLLVQRRSDMVSQNIAKGDIVMPPPIIEVLTKEAHASRAFYAYDNPPTCDSSRRGQVLGGETMISTSGPTWSTFTRMKMCIKSDSGKYEWRSMQ